MVGLTQSDRTGLEALLRDEADMAFRRRALWLFDRLDLRDGDRVFDCGCGMGFHLKTMGGLRRLQLTGLDDDYGRLLRARSEAIQAGLVKGDVVSLPFADASFDKILLTEVLEHVAEDVGALQELYRVLKPGGRLAISVPHAEYPFWWDPPNRIWSGLGGAPLRTGPVAGIWSNHERLYSPDVLTARVAGAGFAVTEVAEATHYGFPFIHFLVYGIGKPLLERGLLPEAIRRDADRFRNASSQRPWWNPVRFGVAAFRAVDRRNDSPAAMAGQKTFVNVLLLASKPG
jgi:SAM-dependent methyltransferase